MNLKTYQAYSMGDVLTRIRKDLGEHAVVLHTRTFRRGGILGLGARTVYEVTAADSRYLQPDVKIQAVDRGSSRPSRTKSASNGRSAKVGEQQARPSSATTSTSTSASKALLNSSTRSEPEQASSAGSRAESMPSRARSRINPPQPPINGQRAHADQNRTRSTTPSSESTSAGANPQAMTPAELLASLVDANERGDQMQRSALHVHRKVRPSADSSAPAEERAADSPPATSLPSIPKGATPAPMNQVDSTRSRPSQSVVHPGRVIRPGAGVGTARRFIIDPQTGRAIPAPKANLQQTAMREGSAQPASHKPVDDSESPLLAERSAIKQAERSRTNGELTSAPATLPDSESKADVQASKHAGAEIGNMRAELEALRGMVQHVLKAQSESQNMRSPAVTPDLNNAPQTFDAKRQDEILTREKQANDFHASLVDQYARLIENEVAEELAAQICTQVQQELSADELDEQDRVREQILRHLTQHIAVSVETITERVHTSDGRPLTMALIGPTGVGKTTTIAKLAAAFKLRDGLEVGLITTDTYRIAAVDQLRTYANIIGVPLRVAITPSEIAAACLSLRNVDVILIDTAGRSPNDTVRIEEIHSFLDAARPHETHLVLSSASSEAVLLRTIERFSSVPTESVIFTKLDEAVNFGVIVNVMQKVGKRLSFITTGQEVPDQIERGEPRRLARLILGESLRE